MRSLRELSAKQPVVQNVRGQGLMIGFDLLITNQDASAEIANAFMYVCRRRGVHLTYGYEPTNIRIIPPLVITRSEIDFAIEVIDKSLDEVLAKQHFGKELWPSNPHTRRHLERRPFRRLVSQLWRMSPEELVTKSKEKFRKQFGAD